MKRPSLRAKHRFAASLAAVVLLTGEGLAQDPAPRQRAPEVVFRTEVNYIEVDVFVMGQQGEFLRDLTRDEFEVFEEGARQEITAFNEIAVPIERPVATFAEADTQTNERVLGGRIYVFLLDEAHTDARRSGLAREIASQFIEEQMAPDDIAAVVFTGDRSGAGQAFTSNKRLLLEAVARFAGHKPASATLERLNLIEFQRDTVASRERGPEAAAAPIRGRDLDPVDLERTYNARKSMETLENVARGLGAVRGRRKAILYFGEGIDYDTLDVMRRTQRDAASVRYAMRDAIATANRSNVAVYTIDPRGLMSGLGPDDIDMTAPVTPEGTGIDSQSLDLEVQRSLDSLRTLATQTGGMAVLNTNDFGPAFDSIVRANSQYYLLGYYPSDFRRDGEFRRIEVRVRRPGATVIAREGYLRPRAEDEEQNPGTLATTDTSPEVRELLDSPWAQTGLTLGVTAAAFRGTGAAASVAVTVQLAGRNLPFRQEGDRARNEIEISLIAIDPDGRVQGGDRMLIQPSLRAQTLERVQRLGMRFVRRLELPPGRYQLRVAAREAEQGQRGSVFYDLRVPDFSDEGLAMSGLLLTSRTSRLTLTASTDDQIAQRLRAPTVARAFASDDILTVYAEVYNAAVLAHDGAVTTRVMSAEGRDVWRSTENRADSRLGQEGEFAHKVVIRLADLDPGEYVLQVEARPAVGAEGVSRELPFDIVPARSGRASSDEATPGSESRGQRPSRIVRLEAWMGAIDRHEPGAADEAARMVRSWTPAELSELATDLAVIVRLVDDPEYPVLWVVDPGHPGKPRRAPYSAEEGQQLRAVARIAAARCDHERAHETEDAKRCARNRILKRGAILHTDAAIHVEDAMAPRGSRRPDRWRVRFSDGQQRAVEGAPGHWELAGSLLDNVAPNPGEDETVRLWYLATTAHGQYHERHTRQEDRAIELFPEDAHLLFLAACLHETFASPRIQSLTRSIHVSGTRHGIGPPGAELRKAEQLLRRALKAEPSLTEARVRLGRVLYLLGRPERATRELQQTIAALSLDGGATPEDSLTLYFAEMFFGASVEALGQRERARVSYLRAAALYPRASSPHLALSQLALLDDDRAAALGEVQRALQLPGTEGDPWWRYHAIQGRDAARWFDELYRSLELEP
jgi:VWFA-related protein